MENALIEFYKSENIYNVPLHEKCQNANDCWKKLTHKIPDEALSKIYIPYIGSRYKKLRILVIGINMNNYGGTEAAKNLIQAAKNELPQGKKKLFADKHYRGSMLFYQMERYANILCQSMASGFENNIGESLEYIAYTNHVKCSPDDRQERYVKGPNTKSKPSGQMWKNCGGNILKDEIAILKPNHLVVLGESSNFHYINRLYGWSAKINNEAGNVKKYTLMIDGNEVKCYVFPHPGAPKGINKKLFEDFKIIV